jgi:oxysterol-binding protein-related protein 3/6/7
MLNKSANPTANTMQSYLVRWVQVSEGHTISWSIQPHKKSLNFGLFKHPGGSINGPIPSPGLAPPSTSYINSQTAPSTPITETIPPFPSQPPASPDKRPRSSSTTQQTNNRDHVTASTAQQKLESSGLRTIVAPYKCPAEVVTVGQWDVKQGQGGNYALVFDNTFSKQVSKTATFMLLTYLTDMPPTSGLKQPGPTGSAMSLALASTRGGPETIPGGSISSDSLSKGTSPPRAIMAVPLEVRKSRTGRGLNKAVAFDTRSGPVYAGVMHKRRRKHNTFAKRFFSLDASSGTLAYYKNRQSSALRGAIPLSLAVISVNDRTREFIVDSGAEIWHLRVAAPKEFDGWKAALEKVASAATAVPPAGPPQGIVPATASSAATAAASKLNTVADEQEWVQVEALVGRVAGIRDAVMRLAKDTDPKYLLLPPPGRSPGVSPARTPSEASFDLGPPDDKGTDSKRPFWKRKTSSNSIASGGPTASGFFKRSVSAQHVPTATNLGSAPASGKLGNHSTSKHPGLNQLLEDGMHEHCIQIMHDLDQVVTNFTNLLSKSKQRRRPQSHIFRSPTMGRSPSRASVSSDEFFDAHEGESMISRSQLLEIRRDSADREEEQDFASIVDDGESSSGEDEDPPDGSINTFRRRRTMEEETSLFPRRAKTLTPLPISSVVARRTTVPPPKGSPPSLIAFLRKNVGKDLSTIAMPVSANEPLSALQRLSEAVEYSSLLDSAASEENPTLRLLYVTAFAISGFSSNRAKERAVRKPFNPMLGETFELVREDRGFRLLAEKICHRPVRMAVQAEAANWTFFQCATPTQKFWGKSAELNTEGRARVVLHPQNEVYGYELASSFLRNVLAGEKYVEPVSTMTITCETTGVKAIVAFRAGGMFAGRSEEVSVQCFDGRGNVCQEGLAGKWTTGMGLTRSGADDSRNIWKVGELVDNASSRYGFTLFAAQMNEVTALEKGKAAKTDSRLRPDQRALEDGKVDEAEELKATLEENQRTRRKALEDNGEEWTPKWFTMSGTDGGEQVWKMKSGKEGYWEAREKGNWSGVTDVFEY